MIGIHTTMGEKSSEMRIAENEKPPQIFIGRILLGEITPLIASMKKISARWSSYHQQEDENNPFIKQLRDLQMTILHMTPNSTLEPSVFLDPFLNIIQSEDFVGPITKNSLAAINRILNYGLISPLHPNASNVVESVASAVTHAKFVGTDSGADEVVLCEILIVLRSLILGPVGHLLTDESVCEMLTSCFRISFETRLSELLRNYTRDAIRHMIQLIFSRLPQYKYDPHSKHEKLKMRTSSSQRLRKSKARIKKVSTETVVAPEISSDKVSSDKTSHSDVKAPEASELTDNPPEAPSLDEPESENATESNEERDVLDVSNAHLDPSLVEQKSDGEESGNHSLKIVDEGSLESINNESSSDAVKACDSSERNEQVFTNPQGVKFTPTSDMSESEVLVPYGLPCVREVFRFLISSISPVGGQNTTDIVHSSLNLLAVALEISSDYISQGSESNPLLLLVQNELCHNLLLHVTPETKPNIFLATLRICTLLFESLRMRLKFQLEMFLNKLISIISSESANVSYFYKEHSLEAILQLWRMPGLIAEIFINFDCNVYSANIFEELTKILSKNAFPVQGFYSTNVLSLEALLTVVGSIERNCTNSAKQERESKFPAAADSHPDLKYKPGSAFHSGWFPITPTLKTIAWLKDESVVNRQELLQLKNKKNVIATGTEMFNNKPEKGISYLQAQGIIDSSNEKIALFLRENPHLDKKVMGDFLSKKKNVDILSAFVKSFDFNAKRIDECLRDFLESFRLPGEAPLISIIIEHFSSHWHLSNNNPFGKDDAAFTLAYAVIMLNVDQHNQNAKKQNIPMTLEQFCKNLRGVNNGTDFDHKMLEEIYNAVRKDEIVMPAEQTGLVKENYLWKMLMKRSKTEEGKYLLINDNVEFDRELFGLCWGPTIASLSYVFDKSSDEKLVYSALSGFKKCAQISARFLMSDVFDNLIISLCKFTTLTVNCRETPENVAITFGRSKKAQLAAKTLFKLTASHPNILREGWRNVLELLLQLFRCDLLPDILVESEDFVNSDGKIRLVKANLESLPRVESGIFSSLYSYIALGDSSNKNANPEDLETIKMAKKCIASYHPEKIIHESAFLHHDFLNELLKAMIGVGSPSSMTEMSSCGSPKVKTQDDPNSFEEYGLDEYSRAFLLELVISLLVANKDRAGDIWPSVRDHIYSLLMSAVAVERYFLLERCVVAILKAAKMFLRRPELANLILQSLRMLLLLKPHVLDRVALQIVSGIHEVLSMNADHIQDSNDWAILLALLECAGSAAKPPPVVNPEEHSEHKESKPPVDKNSDVDSTEHDGSKKSPPNGEQVQNSGGWILVGREGEIEPMAVRSLSINEWDIVHQRQFSEHQLDALIKSVDTLSLLVRERHITAVNLPSVVQTCRTFVEATLHGGFNEKKLPDRDVIGPSTKRKPIPQKELERRPKSPHGRSSPVEFENPEIAQSYQQLSEKLLDLMDTLHTSASHILDLKSQEKQALQCFHLNQMVSLWEQALCPLLQGIARYCCDVRPSIRSSSLTCLQRALLNHDLQTLSASEWESCFNRVLFPLLAKLLQPMDYNGTLISLEETRVRAATLVQKVFLRHLTPLLSLPTFTALWLTVLDFMDKYLNTHRSDHLGDAIPEILKNMLLVMETTQVFHTTEGFTQLWSITWDRIDAFLPNFRSELFKSHPPSNIHRSKTENEEKSDDSVDTPTTHEKDTTSCSTTKPVSEQTESQPPNIEAPQVLSLTHEVSPEALGTNIILQPPLPHIFPLSSSPPTPSAFCDVKEKESDSLVCQNILSDFGSSSLVNVPHIIPINNSNTLFDPTQNNLLHGPQPQNQIFLGYSQLPSPEIQYTHSNVSEGVPSECQTLSLGQACSPLVSPEPESGATDSSEPYKPASLLFNNTNECSNFAYSTIASQHENLSPSQSDSSCAELTGGTLPGSLV